MNAKEKIMAVEAPVGGFTSLLAILALMFFLSIPLSLASEAQHPATAKDPAQPVVQATAT